MLYGLRYVSCDPRRSLKGSGVLVLSAVLILVCGVVVAPLATDWALTLAPAGFLALFIGGLVRGIRRAKLEQVVIPSARVIEEANK